MSNLQNGPGLAPAKVAASQGAKLVPDVSKEEQVKRHAIDGGQSNSYGNV